jgi:flagellar hook-associated protein 3 FlgL
MSGGISGIGPSGYGILGQMISDSTSINNRLNTLTEQASSGLISQTYAGLGTGAAVSLNLNPQLTAMRTWQNNIGQATGTMGMTQSAMTQLQAIASAAVADCNNLNNLNPTEVDSIAANARSALTQVAGLLDTQDGGVYIFGGQDTSNPPVPDPNNILSSPYFHAINTQVTNLGPGTAAATLLIGGLDDPDPSDSPFSAYMSQPVSTPSSPTSLTPPVVQAGANSMVQSGLLASANSAIPASPGPPASTTSTGSYMRDLMRALATIGSMSSSQANDPNFAPLVQNTLTSLNGAVSAMATESGVLGDRQTALIATQTALSDSATALTSQVSSAQNVNMAATLSELTQTQTQLQASYQLIAGESGLSLAKFLPAG